ncbi:MAG: hypothetical protein R2745_11455 [Vicinamibacterales bacterium]
MRWRPSLVAPVLLAALAAAHGVLSAQPLPDEVSSLPWVVDGGYVESHARAGTRIYVGGSFRSVARPSAVIGPFGAFDAATAELLAADPSLKGAQVQAVTPDGAGGWFLGGRFVVGGRVVGVLRLDAAGRRSPWAVEIDGQVYAMTRAGSRLYLAGTFATVAGQPRRNVAAVDVGSGAALSWNPGVDGTAAFAIEAAGTDVFVGGSFTAAGGAPRANLARLDGSTGTVLAWAPAVSGAYDTVRAIEVTATTVFVGGGFQTIDGVPRQNFAAIDRATGAVLGAAPNPGGGPYGLVMALATAGGTVYLGGIFEQVAGVQRYNAAAVDAVSGALLSWAPIQDVEGAVRAIQPMAGGLVLGGDLGLAGRRRHVAKVDAVAGAVIPSWDPATGAEVLGLAAEGSRAGVAGYFGHAPRVAGPRARRVRRRDRGPGAAAGRLRRRSRGGCVADDAARRRLHLRHWRRARASTRRRGRGDGRGAAVRAAGRVRAAREQPPLVANGAVYASGSFTSVNGQPRDHVAAFHPTTGALLPFQPAAFGGLAGPPFLMAAAGGRVWVGGAFTSVGGQPRSNLAALDAVTGALDPLNLAPDAPVSMAVDGGALYLGGGFTTLGGQPRAGLARIDAQTGLLDAWSPPLLAGLGGIGANAGLVIARATIPPFGSFNDLYAIDAATGAPTLAWGRSITPTSSGLSLHPDGLFLPEGDVGGAPRFLVRRTGGAVEAVRDFGVHLQGNLLTMRWTPSLTGAAPTSYRLAVGTRPGATDVANLSLGPVRQLTANIPPGRYFVRLYPQAGGAEGPPTSELAFAASAGGCTAPPGAPVLTVSGGAAPILSWNPDAGSTPTGYEVRAGVAPGLLHLVTVPVAAPTTSLSTAGAPPGRYHAAVAAVNACGVSVASNEVQVVVPSPVPPSPPTSLAAQVTGTTVSLSWGTAGGPITASVLEAGSHGLTDLVQGLAVSATALTAPGVPAGQVLRASGP